MATRTMRSARARELFVLTGIVGLLVALIGVASARPIHIFDEGDSS